MARRKLAGGMKFSGLTKMIERPPKTATYVLALIRFFGFYQEWIPYYEIRIRHWTEYKKNAPPTNTSKEIQIKYLQSKWSNEDQALLHQLAAEVMKKPI